MRFRLGENACWRTRRDGCSRHPQVLQAGLHKKSDTRGSDRRRQRLEAAQCGPRYRDSWWDADRQPQSRRGEGRNPLLSWLSIQTATVSRKLPTMMPTLAVMAMAVASAAVRTDMRPTEARRERAASRASTPRLFSMMRCVKRHERVDKGRDNGCGADDQQQHCKIRKERLTIDGRQAREECCANEEESGDERARARADRGDILFTAARHGFDRSRPGRLQRPAERSQE